MKKQKFQKSKWIFFNLVPFSQNYFSKVDFDLLDYEKTDGTISDETFNRLSKNLSEEKYLAIKTSKDLN